MRRALLFAALAGIAFCESARGAPNVLAMPASADPQCYGQVTPAVTATAGAGVINSPIFLDYDLSVPSILSDASNSSATTIRSIATNATVNHAPYFVAPYCFGISLGGGALDGESILSTGTTYQAAIAAGAVFVGPGPQAGAIASQVQLSAVIMQVTSPNSADGNQGTGGYGSEFFLSANYLGLFTGSDSGNIGNLSGIAAAVAYAHSGYNAFDVHAVLRQTASAWATGWNTTNGYGTINYSTAAGSISSIYLQPPNTQIANHGWYATLTLYPFRATRRAHEVIYSCTAGYSWPVKNEYALSDVTAGCGTLLYTSNGTDQTPVYTFVPAASGSVTFVTFTTDGSGAYSRVDSWVPQIAAFTVGAACSR